MFRNKKILVLAVSAVFFAAAGGCMSDGGMPDIVSTEKKEGQKYSAADIRRMTLDHPERLSGDYFLNREFPEPITYETEILKSKVEELEEKTKKEDSSLEARVERLEKKLGSSYVSAEKTSGPAPAEPGKKKLGAQEESGAEASESMYAESSAASGKTEEARLVQAVSCPLKIGFYLGEVKASSADSLYLVKAAESSVLEGMQLFNHSAVHEVLASTGCIESGDYECMARNLSLYPGIRMLVAAEKLELPDSFPGRALFRASVMDAGLVYTYPPMEMTSSLESEEEVPNFLRDAMARVFAYAAGKADIMPGHCRIFSVKSGRAYMSAGRMSGIEPGMEFTFVSDGEIVESPTGLPVGWLPGERKGVLKVKALVGKNAAACTLKQGEMPRQGGYVLFGGQAAGCR